MILLVKKSKFVFMVVFVTIVCVMMGVIIEGSKDMTTDSGRMVDSDSGKTLQCASAELVILDGALVSRATADAAAGRRLADLSANSLDAIAVRNYYKSQQVRSTLPSSYFRDLEWLSLESSDGSTMSFKIEGITRVPHNKASCGSFLKLVTASGVLVLDDGEIYYDDNSAAILAQSGDDVFNLAVTTPSSTTGNASIRVLRYLSDDSVESHKRGFRRLQSTDATSSFRYVCVFFCCNINGRVVKFTLFGPT
jgi:hypothetical protein